MENLKNSMRLKVGSMIKYESTWCNEISWSLSLNILPAKRIALQRSFSNVYFVAHINLHLRLNNIAARRALRLECYARITLALIDRYFKLPARCLKSTRCAPYHATKFAQKLTIASTHTYLTCVYAKLVSTKLLYDPSRLVETQPRDRLSMSFVKVFR